MLKLASILLAHLILFQSLNVNLESFSKLKVLFEHAQFHQEEYGDSFMEFLTSHYFEINLDSNEHKEHQNLPFKHQIENCTHINLACLNPTLIFEIKEIMQPKSSSKYFYKESYSYSNKTSIFQPPRLL